MMKNVKIYKYFLKNINKKFYLKNFKITLTKTYIYSFDKDKNIYYRKKNIVPRKISLISKPKIFKINGLNLKKINYKKYKMEDISKILYEYIDIVKNSDFINNDDFDIAKKDRKTQIMIDSVVRKGELVTMQFENKKKNLKNKFKNVFWINDFNKLNGYNKNVNHK